MFKKITAVLLALSFAIGCFFLIGCGGGGDDEPVMDTPAQKIENAKFLYPDKNEDFRYKEYDTYIEIIQCLSLKSNIVIPSKIDNLPVYIIADNAFSNQTTIKSVVISEGIIKIGANAFSNCSMLSEVSFPSTLEEVGENTFRGCPQFTSAVIPNTLSVIPSGMFSNCENLTYVIIEEPANKPAENPENPDEPVETDMRQLYDAFSKCPNLKYAWIPADIQFAENPFGGSIENLTIYGYSECDSAVYCADNFLDFYRVTATAQDLVKFKTMVTKYSSTQSISVGENISENDIKVSVEKAFVLRDKFDYQIIRNVDKNQVIDNYTYNTPAGSVIVFAGIKIFNDTSRAININFLDLFAYMDDNEARFSVFGKLKNSQIQDYSEILDGTINPGETKYGYLAIVAPEDWSKIVIKADSIGPLSNISFVIENNDKVTTVLSENYEIIDNNGTEGEEKEQTVEDILNGLSLDDLLNENVSEATSETTTAETSEETSEAA